MVDKWLINMNESELFNYLDTNIMKLVLELGEFMQEESLRLHLAGEYKKATPAQLRLFNVLRGNERTISDIARRLGVSRQAVHKTVHQLIDVGFLKLKKSKNNRDQIVCFTKKGQNARLKSAKILMKIENEFMKKVGINEYLIIKNALLSHYVETTKI